MIDNLHNVINHYQILICITSLLFQLIQKSVLVISICIQLQ